MDITGEVFAPPPRAPFLLLSNLFQQSHRGAPGESTERLDRIEPHQLVGIVGAPLQDREHVMAPQLPERKQSTGPNPSGPVVGELEEYLKGLLGRDLV